MSSLSFSSEASARRPSILTRIPAVWTNAVQAWRIRKADHALHGFSDEMLHDIGIARSEIEDATRHGRPARP